MTERIRVLQECRDLVEKERQDYEDAGLGHPEMALRSVRDEIDRRIQASQNAARLDHAPGGPRVR